MHVNTYLSEAIWRNRAPTNGEGEKVRPGVCYDEQAAVIKPVSIFTIQYRWEGQVLEVTTAIGQ